MSKTDPIEFREWGVFDDNFQSPSHLSGYEKLVDRQFTGLTDKNGKDIWEGDFLTSMDDDRKIVWVVVWVAERCAFTLMWVDEYNDFVEGGWEAVEANFENEYVEMEQKSTSTMWHNGNIYQHPELLSC